MKKTFIFILALPFLSCSPSRPESKASTKIDSLYCYCAYIDTTRYDLLERLKTVMGTDPMASIYTHEFSVKLDTNLMVENIHYSSFAPNDSIEAHLKKLLQEAKYKRVTSEIKFIGFLQWEEYDRDLNKEESYPRIEPLPNIKLTSSSPLRKHCKYYLAHVEFIPRFFPHRLSLRYKTKEEGFAYEETAYDVIPEKK